jgi:AcrR family transcriptional regulator
MQKTKPSPEQLRSQTRKHTRREATRVALLDKAEAMFATKGIDGVSLRQIGVAIGSANANVIGYHFGTKDTLLKAILLRNRGPIEARRAELLEQAKRLGRVGEMSVLLEALCRPIYELTNAEGRHTYAIFLGHVARSDWAKRLALKASFPVTQEILTRISNARRREITDLYFRERIKAVGDILTGMILRFDTYREDSSTRDLLFADMLRMANAILGEPIANYEQGDQRSNNEDIKLKDSIFGM